MREYKFIRCLGTEELSDFINKANKEQYEIIGISSYGGVQGGIYTRSYRESDSAC